MRGTTNITEPLARLAATGSEPRQTVGAGHPCAPVPTFVRPMIDDSDGFDIGLIWPKPVVAALYVETGGCYFDQPGVVPYDEARDARTYDGPWPVVAHPPCQRWGAMAAVNYARWGGEHNRPGNDGGCFKAALHAVRMWGGVLEHPAKSRAWAHHHLTAPRTIGWQRCFGGGWVCEVWQSAYGHRANKATWLYVAGDSRPQELNWSRPVGTHQVGFHDQRGKARNKPTLGRREAAATPPAFRDALLSIAREAKPFQHSAARLAHRDNPSAPLIAFLHNPLTSDEAPHNHG